MDRKIIQAHNKITKTKGKEYAPTFTEIQKEIDKMENKKTAVEWLESIIQAMNENGGDLGEDYPALLEHIKKAKQMEKQQIIDTFYDAILSDLDGEQYYQETYK